MTLARPPKSRGFQSLRASDQKRLVRGEHWLMVRTFLRARDETHHAKWHILIVAGDGPAAEINAIREVMPSAWIVAVDRQPAAIEAAQQAGADEVILCDLAAWTTSGKAGYRVKRPPSVFAARKFDAINLDVCGTVNRATYDLLRMYRRCVTSRGVFMATFAVGRDVIEMYAVPRYESENLEERLIDAKIPEHLRARLKYLFRGSRLGELRSVMSYRGMHAPMCAVLLYAGPWRDNDLSFVRVDPHDFERVVVTPLNAERLYDCPRERIEALRRKYAALKAVRTRTPQVVSTPRSVKQSATPRLWDDESEPER